MKFLIDDADLANLQEEYVLKAQRAATETQPVLCSSAREWNNGAAGAIADLRQVLYLKAARDVGADS